jgi:hypothetical protein
MPRSRKNGTREGYCGGIVRVISPVDRALMVSSRGRHQIVAEMVVFEPHCATGAQSQLIMPVPWSRRATSAIEPVIDG